MFKFHRIGRILLSVSSLLALVGVCHSVRAQTATCDALPAPQRGVVRDLLAALHPYDGCDATFAKCLAEKPPAPVVLRLTNDICRQVKAGKDRAEVEHALEKRAQSMLAITKPSVISIDDATRAGSADAPVLAVVYACSRCPFCRMLVPALHREVTVGSLKGKVRLYFRPFPLKDHTGSTEGGLAMLSAARLGRFWPFVVDDLYGKYDTFCPALLPSWAESAGMDKAAFEKAFADPSIRDALIAAKQEGIRNKVTATPTLFINGHKYVYDLTPEIVIDVLEEAFEASRKRK
jgi:protein-disulfide isomerase